jgi:hypothetical protein
MLHRTRSSCLRPVCRLAGVVALIAILTSACGRRLSYEQLEALVTRCCDTDANHFLLDKLTTHRIVMLTDQGHGYPMYLQRVISFLNFWIDTLERSDPVNTPVPSDLVLILETDSLNLTRRLQQVAMGCELDSMRVEELTANITVERQEFSSDLVELLDRIAMCNEKRVTLRPIQFRIAGAESVFTDVANWSHDKRGDYFVHRRDEQISERIVKLLDNDPAAKALVFYGAGHFSRDKVTKKADQSSSEGYFLNHYLTAKYGREGVYAIDQIAVNRANSTPFPCAYRLTYALDYDSLPRRDLPTSLCIGSMDGAIVDYGKFILPTPISHVSSQRLVDLIVPQLHRISDTRNDFYLDTWGAMLRYLHAISAAPFLSKENLRDPAVISRLEETWTAWRDTVHLQVVKDIDSLVFYKRLVDLMKNSQRPFTSWYETEISTCAGFVPYYDTLATAEQRAADIWQYLQDNRHDIVVGNMVSLLWVGTSDERSEALQVLKRETGKDFETAKEWTVWRRENCPPAPRM